MFQGKKIFYPKIYSPFLGKRLRVGTLNYNQLKTNSTVDVYSHSDCTQIFVKPLNKTTKTMLDIELSATVEELKARIQSLLAIPIDQQRLVYDGNYIFIGILYIYTFRKTT